jgi:hypothetical protein
MKRSKKLVFSDEAIKQLGITKKEFVAQLGKHAYEPQWAKAKQTDSSRYPDYPEPSDYDDIKSPGVWHDFVEHYRKDLFNPYTPPKNAARLKAITDAALTMHEQHPEWKLRTVPLSETPDCPTEQDFIRLESWFADAQVKWLATMETPKEKTLNASVTPPKTDATKNVSAEAKAVAILIDHPEWSDTRIAHEADINRTTLYKLPKFMEARRLLKEQGKKSLPRGSKDGETGTMEAWEK